MVNHQSSLNKSPSPQTVCVGTDESLCPLVPKISALTIGINRYPNESLHFPPLKGAVDDADSVSRFLIQYRGADSGRITDLRDGDATRDKIMNSLQGFVNDPLIKQEDTIVIYFAGHTKGPTKGCYGEGDTVALWAVDSSLDDAESCITRDEIYKLLSAISESKGCSIVSLPPTSHYH